MKNPLTSVAKRVARLRRTPVVARRRGAQFLLDPGNWIDNRMLAGAPYEDGQIAAAREVIIRDSLDLFIDIGANIGLYTVLLGLETSITSVVAFEPVARNHAQLMANLFLNGLTGKVEVHRIGLGASSSEVMIHIDPKSTGLSRVDLATAGRAREVFTESEIIRVEPFDRMCQMTGRRAYAKIDVEGHALAVLQGMSAFLQNNVAVLQVELQSSESEAVVAYLGQRGFRLDRQIEGDGMFVCGTAPNDRVKDQGH